MDESWIGGAGWESGIVRLIPRMKDWVTANYTGTKLAITEYNWGALDHINGAVAQADVLGIFGREGLDLATLWGPPDVQSTGRVCLPHVSQLRRAASHLWRCERARHQRRSRSRSPSTPRGAAVTTP